MTRQALPGWLRSIILRDDEKRCLRCGRPCRKGIEVHHLVPVVYGGTNAPSNLIPLCGPCHRNAPDSPVDFIRWCATPFPPPLDSFFAGYEAGFKAAWIHAREHRDEIDRDPEEFFKGHEEQFRQILTWLWECEEKAYEEEARPHLKRSLPAELHV